MSAHDDLTSEAVPSVRDTLGCIQELRAENARLKRQLQEAMHPFFSSWEIDPTGVALDTGFMRFETKYGIDGLAKLDGDNLEVLAVVSTNPRQGRFRDFIAAAKITFASIAVLEIWEPIVEAALGRYGFTAFERTEPDGERVTGMIWKRA